MVRTSDILYTYAYYDPDLGYTNAYCGPNLGYTKLKR